MCHLWYTHRRTRRTHTHTNTYRFITNIVNYGMLFRLQLHRRRFPSNFRSTAWFFFFLLTRFSFILLLLFLLDWEISCSGFYCFNRLLKTNVVRLSRSYIRTCFQLVSLFTTVKRSFIFGVPFIRWHLTSLQFEALYLCEIYIYMRKCVCISFGGLVLPNHIDFNERTVPFHFIPFHSIPFRFGFVSYARFSKMFLPLLRASSVPLATLSNYHAHHFIHNSTYFLSVCVSLSALNTSFAPLWRDYLLLVQV